MPRKLFNEPPDGWASPAMVGGAWTSEWSYAIGYLEAAGSLVDSAIQSHQMDTFFYPICFLYRHAAEVTLKELIRETERLIGLSVELGEVEATEERTDEEVEERLTNTHGLDGLFRELESRLALVSDQPIPDMCKQAVAQLHEEDPTGQRFRFSRVKRGPRKARTVEPSFEKGQRVDLLQLRGALSEAIGMLQGGVGGWLSNQVSVASDMLSTLEDEVPYEGP